MEIRKYLNRLYFTLWWVFIAIMIVLMNWWFLSWQKWLDLAGWVRLLYKMDFSQYEKNYKWSDLQQQEKNVVNVVKKNIDSRISKLWVSDYNARYIVLWGESYIEVSLWWVKDVEKAKKIIWKTVQMTFKVPFEWEVTKDIKNQRQLLAEKILTYLKENNQDKVVDYVSNPRAWNINPSQTSISWENLEKIFWKWIKDVLTWWYVYPKLITSKDSFDIYQFLSKKGDKYNFVKLSVLFKPQRQDAKYKNRLLNWERFKMATVSTAQNGQIAVNVYFDDLWRDMFCKLTEKYLHKQMAIFVWNKLVTDPVIQAQICGWVAQITWRYTIKTAKQLADDLNTWAMPVPLKLEQEQKVSSILWWKAFTNSLIAAWLWVILIFVMFLFAYWFKYAVVTVLSLIIFFLSLAWFIKLFWVVLSLSAIWAIILNIGMAVDANVIMFERLKEELRAWSSFSSAVMRWYEHSVSAIRDGNLTTWLIAFLLFMIWTNIFKWFGTMMIVNIFIVLVIMFPAIPWLLLLLNKSKK